MSHAATNWAIKQRGLKPATKIVLWFLADCHNAHTGQCNPKQATLADLCEMSRSTVNLHLEKLERAGLLRRVQTIDPLTKKQRPTHYELALEGAIQPVSENRTPPQDVESRPQDVAQPCPKTGHGAVSENRTDPCPKNEHSRVRNSDTKNLGREPGKEPCAEKPAHTADFDFEGFFENFSRTYPRVGSPEETERQLRAALDAGVDPQQILYGAKSYAEEQAGNLRPGRTSYIAYSENWLEKKRWRQFAASPRATVDPRQVLMARAQNILEGKPFVCRSITVHAAGECITAGLVTPADCHRAGIQV